MKQCLIALGILTLTAVGPVAAQPAARQHRDQLVDVLCYQRLIEGGCRLAYRTYGLQEVAFQDAERSELAAAAALFQALAAMELNEQDRARDALGRHAWDGGSDWQAMGALLFDRLESNRPRTSAEDDADVPAETRHGWRELIPTTSNETWNDIHSGSLQASRFESIAAESSYAPVLTLTAEGKVTVNYEFFDVAIFRIEALRRVQLLADAVTGSREPDSLLVRLWCELLLQRYDNATASVQSLGQAAVERRLSADQVEELQCLGAVLADRIGKTQQVETFLKGRVEKPPTYPWALRAINLLSGDVKARLSVLQQTVKQYSQDNHPLSRQVLSNQRERTERVLDCYWEVAWAQRCRALQETEGQFAEAPTRQILATKRLVDELASPTVTETWRPMSSLRLESVFELHSLAGDCETWQLELSDEMLSAHPIFEPVVQLSRSYAGLVRTSQGPGDVQSLASDATKDSVLLLLGDDQDVSIDSLAVEPEERTWGWKWPVVFLLVSITVLFIVWRKVRMQ